MPSDYGHSSMEFAGLPPFTNAIAALLAMIGHIMHSGRACGQELDKHVVKVDMWRVSCWTFNEYFGLKKQKLSLIANRDPNMELRILRKLSRALSAFACSFSSTS